MTIAIRAKTDPISTNGTSVSVNKPTGTLEGDFMLLMGTVSSTASGLLAAPADWTQIQRGGLNDDDPTVGWFKIAGASEPSSYTLTVNSTDSIGAGIITFYSDSASPITIDDVQQQYNSSGNRVYPSVTFSDVGYLICYGTTLLFNTTPPAGLTEQWDVTINSNRAYCMTKAGFGPGSTSTITATGTSAASNCISLALVEGTTIYRCPQWRSYSSYGPTNSTTSFDVTIPADVEVGDLLLLQVVMDAERTVSTPSGWTLIGYQPGSGGQLIYQRTAQAGDAGATVTVAFSGALVAMIGIITAIYSPNGKPLAVSDTVTASASAAASIAFPSVTANGTDALLIGIASSPDTTGVGAGAHDGFFERIDLGATACRAIWGTELLSVAGATSARSLAFTSSTHNYFSFTLIVEEITDVIVYPDLANGVALWIDVYDSSNNKLGPGPLFNPIGWRNVRRLSRAGEFSVSFPATDMRLHEIQDDGYPLLHSDRYLYCYGILDGAVALIGAGWVKNIELSRSGGAVPTIAVSGPDLLGELRKATVYDQDRPYQYSIEDSDSAPADLMDGFAVTPFMPDDWTITGGDPTATNVTAKFVHASLLSALIDVGSKIGEFFRLGSSNNGRNLVWIGPPSSFADCGIRAELSVDPVAAEGNSDICIITNVSEIKDSWDLYTRVFVFGAGSGHDRLDLAAVTHWPDGDRLRSTITAISGDGTTVSVTTSEDHEVIVGEVIEIFGTVNYDGNYTVDTVPTTTTLTYLSAATGSETAGYLYGDYFHDLDGEEHFFNRLETSLENRDARTLYGRHHTSLQFKEISPISNSDADISAAANALLAQAYSWLRERSTPARFYRLAVAKLDALILPGQTIHVVAKRYIDNLAYINIDTDLTILEASTEIGNGGVRTTSLVVATVDRWPSSDGEQAASEFHQSNVYQSLAQLGPNVDTISYREQLDDDTGATLYFFLGEETVSVNGVVVRFRTDKLRSTVKSVGGSSATTDSGGSSSPTTSSGGGATPTSSSGGGATPTSSSGGGSTPTTTSYAPVTNHAHGLEITDLTPTGSALYYDTAVGLNANLGTGDETGGSTTLADLPLTHDHDVTIDAHTHDVTIDAHTHDVTISAHTHDVTIAAHTHDVTAAVTTVYGIYEDPGTAYAATDLEISINGGAWRSDYSAISGASGWYVLDITAEVSGLALRPLQAANSVAVRVKSASQVGNKAQITAQIERRVVIQSIAQF